MNDKMPNITPPSPDEIKGDAIIMGKDREFVWQDAGRGRLKIELPLGTGFTERVFKQVMDYSQGNAELYE